ncbi:hypothetical protein NLM27_43085 [Bradyrhizobium sp. CCGB12]|uniref:c-type cytochrome n=1 Tax=Bradyrhizobium sp. CCGB12 TaxID=2949632 RepID=UPI0020B2C983|nr:hypothetical protein [Bradyrhizobium sp. CCGB12]MCP3395483.1 hypothetical protein [Bradyrhizobium sp. CCGB12]
MNGVEPECSEDDVQREELGPAASLDGYIQNSPDNMAAWIEDPQRALPGNAMPEWPPAGGRVRHRGVSQHAFGHCRRAIQSAASLSSTSPRDYWDGVRKWHRRNGLKGHNPPIFHCESPAIHRRLHQRSCRTGS